jgi:hypothetical protein
VRLQRKIESAEGHEYEADDDRNEDAGIHHARLY